MKMTHDQTERLIGVVIAFIIALLSIFGYNVAVVQPAMERAATISVMGPDAYAVNCSAVLACVEGAK